MRQYEAQLVGFALVSCRVCNGTGRLAIPRENGSVDSCPCVVFFEKTTLLKEAAKQNGEQKQQRNRGTAEA